MIFTGLVQKVFLDSVDLMASPTLKMQEMSFHICHVFFPQQPLLAAVRAGTTLEIDLYSDSLLLRS